MPARETEPSLYSRAAPNPKFSIVSCKANLRVSRNKVCSFRDTATAAAVREQSPGIRIHELLGPGIRAGARRIRGPNTLFARSSRKRLSVHYEKHYSYLSAMI